MILSDGHSIRGAYATIRAKALLVRRAIDLCRRQSGRSGMRCDNGYVWQDNGRSRRNGFAEKVQQGDFKLQGEGNQAEYGTAEVYGTA